MSTLMEDIRSDLVNIFSERKEQPVQDVSNFNVDEARKAINEMQHKLNNFTNELEAVIVQYMKPEVAQHWQQAGLADLRVLVGAGAGGLDGGVLESLQELVDKAEEYVKK